MKIFFFTPRSLALLSCGFVKMPLEDLYTHVHSSALIHLFWCEVCSICKIRSICATSLSKLCAVSQKNE